MVSSTEMSKVPQDWFANKEDYQQIPSTTCVYECVFIRAHMREWEKVSPWPSLSSKMFHVCSNFEKWVKLKTFSTTVSVCVCVIKNLQVLNKIELD